ncbi:hypothetical protein B0H17DRAFT_1216851 [Mycena rosella]|uniref:Uncharacterized protein n=1 Tax=Mycena rosella TaxID=1033263 RepID=A0AAD7FQL7_MYCRO|nr:hypothetical protein B0H17DRAFT_1216851 [Mycena rosella]
MAQHTTLRTAGARVCLPADKIVVYPSLHQTYRMGTSYRASAFDDPLSDVDNRRPHMPSPRDSPLAPISAAHTPRLSGFLAETNHVFAFLTGAQYEAPRKRLRALHPRSTPASSPLVLIVSRPPPPVRIPLQVHDRVPLQVHDRVPLMGSTSAAAGTEPARCPGDILHAMHTQSTHTRIGALRTPPASCASVLLEGYSSPGRRHLLALQRTLENIARTDGRREGEGSESVRRPSSAHGRHPSRFTHARHTYEDRRAPHTARQRRLPDSRAYKPDGRREGKRPGYSRFRIQNPVAPARGSGPLAALCSAPYTTRQLRLRTPPPPLTDIRRAPAFPPSLLPGRALREGQRAGYS